METEGRTLRVEKWLRKGEIRLTLGSEWREAADRQSLGLRSSCNKEAKTVEARP